MSSQKGSCYVNPDGKITTLNPWALNNHANILFINQPISAGFSYISLVNGNFDLLSNTITSLEGYENIPGSNITFSQDASSKPGLGAILNITRSTAKNWPSKFPKYISNNNKISILGNSVSSFPEKQLPSVLIESSTVDIGAQPAQRSSIRKSKSPKRLGCVRMVY